MPAATSTVDVARRRGDVGAAGGHRADLHVAAGGAHRDVTGGGLDLHVSRSGLGLEFADVAQPHVTRCRMDPNGPADLIGGHIAAGRPDHQRAQLAGALHVRRGGDELGRRTRRDLHGHIERGAAVEAAPVGSDHGQHSAVELDAGGREEFLPAAASGAGRHGHRGGFGGQRGHGDVPAGISTCRSIGSVAGKSQDVIAHVLSRVRPSGRRRPSGVNLLATPGRPAGAVSFWRSR